MHIAKFLLAALAISPALAGCLDAGGPDDAASGGLGGRHALPFNTTATWSHTLVEGAFGILDPVSEFVDVELPGTEGGAAATGARMHMGLWLPDVPAGTTVPVIADVGPYYSDGDGPAMDPARRLGGFLIENFVPHGYAVAQVSVFGTGLSNHCMDLGGMSEQLGVDAAVEWLGTQDWSNGNVGLIGRSYDGTTPWEAATFGNEHLKTIVPISGLTGFHELMWHNGSAETRGPIMHNFVYGTFGIDTVGVNPFAAFGDPANVVTVNDPDAGDAETLCRGYLTGPAAGASAAVTGDYGAPGIDDYWAQRSYMDRVLANYNGSVYLIHGLQDWNVDPHMAFPAYQQLEAAGLDVKGLFGQWAHMYPDRPSEHERLPAGRGAEAYPATVRYDWAQDLLEWFDFYLMETGPQPSLHAEVQDNMGAWRVTSTFPPADINWTHVGLDAATGVAQSGAGAQIGGAYIVDPRAGLSIDLPALGDDDVRISGLPRFHVTVTPTGPGGQLFVELRDATAGLRLGHAIMDLRYHEGGMNRVDVMPGAPIVARMEMEPLDVVVPAGHELTLVISNTGEDYLPSVVSNPVIVAIDETSVLSLPITTPDEASFFAVVPWSQE